MEFCKNISYLYSALLSVCKIFSKHTNQSIDRHIYILLSNISPKMGFVINEKKVNMSEKYIEIMGLF